MPAVLTTIENAGPGPKAIAVPILVGVTGKRKQRLHELGVSEASVRPKLRQAFALLDDIAPHSPKILLCGMADGVDEIAAGLVLESLDTHEPHLRQFRNWSIVGLVPMPDEAFLDDFDASRGEGWWYHKIDYKIRELIIRLMPLQTLARPPSGSPDCLPQGIYTAAELRRPTNGSNPGRALHYEQLGLVLAERSTVLIAVMPEAERPDRLGGTAQVVAHRLNGWRRDWPRPVSRGVAAASVEVVVPPMLAGGGANDVWLIPIGHGIEEEDSVELRVMRARNEFDHAWPKPLPVLSQPTGIIGRAASWLRPLSGNPDVLIKGGKRDKGAAWDDCRLVRSIDAFNRRAAGLTPRPPPVWDTTIAAHPSEPQLWSPIAAAEVMRGAFSAVQVGAKQNVRRTVTRLGAIAFASVAVLETYAELFHKWGWSPELVWEWMPTVYVLLIALALGTYSVARRNSWSAVAEDYRLIAEALRVQVIWWHAGLIARCDRVDQHVLRYDAGQFQLLRRGLATVLDAILLRHDSLPHAGLANGLPDAVARWIDNADEKPPGQVQYHRNTASNRRQRYGSAEFVAWSMFGVSLGMASCLAIYASREVTQIQVLADAVMAMSRRVAPWLFPLLTIVGGTALLAFAGIKDIKSSYWAWRAPHVIWSCLAGMLFGATAVALWLSLNWDKELLHTTLFLATVLLLAAGGAIRYRTEKLAIEAEAQGSAEALPVYLRARMALEQVDKDCAAHELDAVFALSQREQIIRDLGQYALAETEAWLRSHRERPIHPAMG